jgi:hypothetical protein
MGNWEDGSRRRRDGKPLSPNASADEQRGWGTEDVWIEMNNNLANQRQASLGAWPTKPAPPQFVPSGGGGSSESGRSHVGKVLAILALGFVGVLAAAPSPPKPAAEQPVMQTLQVMQTPQGPGPQTRVPAPQPRPSPTVAAAKGEWVTFQGGRFYRLYGAQTVFNRGLPFVWVYTDESKWAWKQWPENWGPPPGLPGSKYR